jgi:predicted CxxxxCH...CXXCH cytochrome family protein
LFHADTGQGAAVLSACGSCHALPPATRLHGTHAVYDCGQCHHGYSVTVTDSVKPTLYHLNGSVNVNGVLGGGTCDPAGRTCTGISCHGAGQADTLGMVWNNGTVLWRDTLGCHGCHNYRNHMVVELGLPGISCWSCHYPIFHPDTVSAN